MARRKNENGEELETRYEVLKRNYKTVPGFKAVIKLGLYLVFIFIILLMAILTNDSKNQKKLKEDANGVVTEKTISYRESINKFFTKTNEYKYKVSFNNKESLITIKLEDDKLSGLLENDKGTSKFIIKDNKVYEVKMGDEVLNDSLLSDYDVDFINIASLKNTIETGKTNKEVEDDITKYTYDINKDDMDSYKIIVTIKDYSIKNIEISNDIIKYEITN